MLCEKFPTICPECQGKVVLGDESVRYGMSYGKEILFFCLKCHGYAKTVLNEKSKMYEAIEPIRGRKTRKDQLIVLNMIKKKYENLPEAIHNQARDIIYKHLALHLEIPYEECYVKDMYYRDIIKAKILLAQIWPECEKEMNELLRKYYKSTFSEHDLRKLNQINKFKSGK